MLTTLRIILFTICIIILELITPTEDFVVESAPFDIEGNFKYFIYIDITHYSQITIMHHSFQNSDKVYSQRILVVYRR